MNPQEHDTSQASEDAQENNANQRNDTDTNRPSEQEFTTLRQAILQWQNFRFVLLGASIALITAIFNIDDKTTPWQIKSSFLLFFLSTSVYLTGYASRGNLTLSTYIEVFHEGAQKDKFGWESRQAKFRQVRPKTEIIRLNDILNYIYISLVVISVAFPFYISDKSLKYTGNILEIDQAKMIYWFHNPWNLVLLMFLVLFYLSYSYSQLTPGMRKYYKSRWHEVEGMVDQEQTPNTPQENTLAVLGVGVAGAIAVVSASGYFDFWDAGVGATLWFILNTYGKNQVDRSWAYSAIWALCLVLVVAWIIDAAIFPGVWKQLPGPWNKRDAVGIGVWIAFFLGNRIWVYWKIKKAKSR